MGADLVAIDDEWNAWFGRRALVDAGLLSNSINCTCLILELLKNDEPSSNEKKEKVKAKMMIMMMVMVMVMVMVA